LHGLRGVFFSLSSACACPVDEIARNVCFRSSTVRNSVCLSASVRLCVCVSVSVCVCVCVCLPLPFAFSCY
jgi:hypothetical protein